MVICLERDADLHMAHLMPLPLTVSCSSKIQIGFTFLVPAHPGSQRVVKQVCVCVVVKLKNRTENTTSRFITDQCPGFHIVWLIVLQFNDCRVRTLLEVIVRVKPNLRLLTTTANQQRSYVNSPTTSHKQGSEFSWTCSHCKLTETAAFYFVSTQHASHAHIVAT